MTFLVKDKDTPLLFSCQSPTEIAPYIFKQVETSSDP